MILKLLNIFLPNIYNVLTRLFLGGISKHSLSIIKRNRVLKSFIAKRKKLNVPLSKKKSTNVVVEACKSKHMVNVIWQVCILYLPISYPLFKLISSIPRPFALIDFPPLHMSVMCTVNTDYWKSVLQHGVIDNPSLVLGLSVEIQYIIISNLN